MKKFTVLFVLFLLAENCMYAQSYKWDNVAFGGGGFVTGVIGHKTSGDVYCRTDVGGAYRWEPTAGKWVPLLDWVSDNETTYLGVEALTIDQQNANNVYMLAGTDYFNGGKTAILKSTDKGNSFTAIDVTSKFKAHGNGMGRSNGERLAVDPNNSNVLFCGSRSNGLWKSIDAGLTWTQAWNGVTSTASGNGICFVVFDPSSASGGTTKTMYIGVSRTGDNNLYKSTDGGNTFTAIQPDNAFMPHRVALSADNSTLYVAMADKEGPWNPTSGRIYKLATATGIWTNITPNGNNLPYGGISIDPTNANRLVVSTINHYGNLHFGAWGDNIFLSNDGGNTWTSKLTSASTIDRQGITWLNGSVHWGGDVQFDPKVANRVRVISGNGIFRCDNINASTTAWLFDVKGIEEVVPLDIATVPNAPMVMVIGDYDGAIYNTQTNANSIYNYPLKTHTPNVGTTSGVAFSTNQSKMVRVGYTKMYYSTDQGNTWTQTSSMNGKNGKLAVSADGATILHCPALKSDDTDNSILYYSTNNGASWSTTNITNVSNAIPVSDFVNANKFYVYNPNNGQFLVSTDKGINFTPSSSSPGQYGSKIVRSVPGNEGHVWVAMNDGGLKYTTNSGNSWTTISGVSKCSSVGYGKAAPNQTYTAIYIYGTVGGVKGLFRSIDQGASWTRINDDAHEWGGTGNGNFVMGDMNVYGRVYMSSVGRGLIVGDDLATCATPSAPTVTSSVSYCQNATAVSLTATASSGNTLQWYGTNASGGTASTIAPTPSTAITGTTTYYVSQKATTDNCESSRSSIAVTVNPLAVITPYAQINGGAWSGTNTASVCLGGSVSFGPQPLVDNGWTWTGPNGFSSTSRQIDLSNVTQLNMGDYMAKYTDGNGCVSSSTMTLSGCTITGLNIEMPSDKIQVYPNPSKSSFKIKTNELSDVKLIDIGGKLLEEHKNVMELELGHQLLPGVYLLNIKGVLYKLVKE